MSRKDMNKRHKKTKLKIKPTEPLSENSDVSCQKTFFGWIFVVSGCGMWTAQDFKRKLLNTVHSLANTIFL